MKVIKEPSKISLCNKCGAVIEFENNNVNSVMFLGGKHGGTRLYVKCPCCNSTNLMKKG